MSTSATSCSRRVSPAGRPPTSRVHAMSDALGMQLVASLDDTTSPPPPPLPTTPILRGATPTLTTTRARSDTFDGLYALGDVDDDVDMADLDVIDADVFRPSALMDRKLDDEYGRTSDLERMLLLSDAQLDSEEDDAVMAHLAQLDAMQGTNTQHQGFAPLAPRSGRWLVTTSHSQAAVAAALPPKYLEGGALASPHKRRVHKRMFGERGAAFKFPAAPTPETKPTQKNPTLSPTLPTPTPTPALVRRSRSLFTEIAQDIAGRGMIAHSEDHNMDHDSVKEEQMEEEEEKQEEEEKETVITNANIALPVDVEEIVIKSEPPVTPVRPRCSPAVLSTQIDSFQTPQRSSQSVATTTQSSLPSEDSAFRTPAHGVASLSSSAASVGAHTNTNTTNQHAISPAPSFDKVAVVHAKDTPGKVDRFEWTIRASPVMTRSASVSGAKRALVADDDLPSPPTPTTASDLPPRYLRGAASSPQKRRVHSSTFGSFARSFSFTDAS